MSGLVSLRPEDDVIEMRLPEAGVVVREWTQYSFSNDFLTPTDGFSFTVAGTLPREVERALLPGTKVELNINGSPQCTGYLDTVDISASRGAGVEFHLSGTDLLGPAVAGTIDPRLKVKPTQTLLDLLVEVFTPFGWSNPDLDFLTNDDINVNIITGQVRGQKSAKGTGKRKPKKTPDQISLDALKPHDSEGAFAFIARVAQRFGLWIWLSAQGDKLIIGHPYFDDPPRYRLVRRRDGKGNNVLSGSVKWDTTDQPSFIVAEGFSGGGPWGHSKLRAVCVNPFVLSEDDDLTTELAKYKPYESVAIAESLERAGATLEFVTRTRALSLKRVKPLYLHDEESKTPEQLACFVRREMSLRTRKSVTARYAVEGHGQDGVPWCINCMVDVEDEITGLVEPMWLKSRTFTKSRSEGTRTELELIRPYTLEF